MDEIMDTKVVQMKFDNAQFRAGVQDTIKQLETLENSLELKGASDGLDEVVRASKRTTGSMTSPPCGVIICADKNLRGELHESEGSVPVPK